DGRPPPCLVFDRWHSQDQAMMYRLPAGPKGHFLTGNLPDWANDRLALLTRCAREFGDMAYLRLGSRPTVVLSPPDLIEEVFATQARHFIKHYALRANPIVFGQGLLSSDGAFWLRQRRLMNPAFTRQRIAAYAPMMAPATERLFARWQPGATIDVLEEMSRLTLDLASKTLFGGDASGMGRTVAQPLRWPIGAFLLG